MTVAAQNTSQQVVAAPGQTVFPFTWRADNSGVVTVWVNDVQDGGFAVFLNADQAAAPGGTVTRAAPAVGGETITIERVSPQTQNTALTRYGPFAADTVTAALDKVVMLIQELSAKVSRSFSFKRVSMPAIASTELPAPAEGAVLTWIKVGGQYRLASATPALDVQGELLADSGDHAHFTSLFAPTSAAALYRNGQRIFSPGDYTLAPGTNIWTLVVPVDPLLGEALNADYTHA